MRILSRHFLASYLKLFAVILFSSIDRDYRAIEMMLNFESVLEHRNGRMGIATYLLLRIPSYYFRDLMPISMLRGSHSAASASQRAPTRLPRSRCGGISPPRTVIPLLCAAAALSGLTLLLNESVVLQASRAWSREQHPGGEITFRQGSFWYHRGNAIYSVQEADREARVLHGVSVYELSPQGRLLQIVRAERVEVDDDRHWRFLDARPLEPSIPSAQQNRPESSGFHEWNRDVTAEKRSGDARG